MTHHTDPNNLYPESPSSEPVRRPGGAAYNLSQLAFTVMLTSTKPMTPANLVDEVAPYLKAIADFQHVINQVKKRQWPEVQLISIIKYSTAQNSPISATLRGIVDAVAFMYSIVTWRRKYADPLQPSNGQPSDMDLQQAKVQLALEILEKTSPHLDEFQKVDFASRLLGPLDILVSSNLEVGAYDSEDI